jgi:hypothetical protein
MVGLESRKSPNEGPTFNLSENLVGSLFVLGSWGESPTVEAKNRTDVPWRRDGRRPAAAHRGVGSRGGIKTMIYSFEL